MLLMNRYIFLPGFDLETGFDLDTLKKVENTSFFFSTVPVKSP